MASVESWTNKSGKQYRVRLTDAEHQGRARIPIGKVTKRQAESEKLYIEQLIACKKTGTVIPPSTQTWLSEVPESIRQKLEDVGLIAPREKKADMTIETWPDEYLAKRNDLKPGTILNLEKVRKALVEFAGSTLLTDFTEGHAEDFRRFLLGKGLAEATIRRRCGRAKQFFTAAVKRRIILDNPFDGIPIADVTNNERLFFIDRVMIQKVLNACPNSQWRLIFALARFGGLRIPSELEHMTWEDVNWLESDRFTVKSPKTEHIDGKAQRRVPMFPELLPYFQAALDEADPDEPLVLPLLGKRSNLRQQALRIIQRAGLEPWPRVFQNLRSSRETELVEEFPVHVVTSWIGNSPDVANRHYLQTHEEHFKKASLENHGTDGGLNLLAEPGIAPQTGNELQDKTGVSANDRRAIPPDSEICEKELVPRRGFEPPTPGLGILCSVQLSYRGT